jgi:hypothetical protein
LAGAVVGLGATYAMPRRWAATATLTVVSLDGSDASNLVLRRARLTDSFFAEIIRRQDFFKAEGMRRSENDMIRQMRKNTRIRQIGPGTLRLEFVDSDPEVAQNVARNIITQFIETNLMAAEEDALKHQVRPPLRMKLLRLPFVSKSTGPTRLAATGLGLAGGLLSGLMAAWFLRLRAARRAV